jgi:pimeloyl-ACP methyl ester carboxylesterase
MNRRQILEGTATAAVFTTVDQAVARGPDTMGKQPTYTPFVRAQDGTNLYVQDWGTGRPIVLLSAWTFNSSVWGEYIAALTASGNRCIALDRRGHGRSDAPSGGYDAGTLADDVAAVFEQRGLEDAVLVAHSMGTVEAVRYLV